MAEAFNRPVTETTQGEDNEQRIDGDGQEVNALRFLGAGAPPVPPPPAITPVSSGVSQPLQNQQQQPQPPQTPHPPPQSSQHSQAPMPTPGGFDFSDPTNYGSMQMPSVPGPFGMPSHSQVPGMMGGGPMNPIMMMPPYNYMYNPYFMPGPYPSMPSAPSNQSQILAMLNVLRVKDPKFYREWYKKYTAHRRNPDRVPFPQIPGMPNVPSGPGSSQTLPSLGRSRKESTRSSVNGDPFRHTQNESFSNLDYSHVPGANTSMSLASYSRSHDQHRQQPHSGRTSVNGEFRPPEDEFGIDGADVSSLPGIGGNGILHSTSYHPNDRDRPQTQSGRSSTVGEPYRLPPGDVYGGYMLDRQPDSLPYDDSYGFQPITEKVRDPSPRRMTPLKFNTMHCIATISPLGHLIRVKSSGTGLEFLKMKQFLGHLPEYKELELFPGPLASDSTHKNTVIQFCRRKIQVARSNTAQIDKDNFILLWEFLILMLRQNGMVVGSDVADLLLEVSQQEEKTTTMNTGESRENLEGGENEEELEQPPPVEPSIPAPEDKTRDEDKLVTEFCEHLLHGHKKDALDFAMDNNLWGYALFFASKMDERSYGHVLARFANGIAVNSPLQTLYHIMSGKQPASVTSCSDENFGDWKPHLAMVLSNAGYKPVVEHKAILTLGDTLMSRNHLYAAQFCYLMGHEEFSEESRLGPLLGYSTSDNNLLEATQMTEIYEFARKLADPTFSLGVSFLQNKLNYAKSLISHGFVQEGLSYCEEIAKTLKTKKIDDAELNICKNTFQIAERIVVADESGVANSTWVEDLRKIIADPGVFYQDSFRKMSHASSDHNSIGSQQYQHQPQQSQQFSQPQDIYDPYNQNQQQTNHNLANQTQPQDHASSSISQFDTAVSTSNTISTSDLDNTYSGIAEIPAEGGNQWNSPNQLNGGLHISNPSQLYEQQQQPPIPNSISSANAYNSGNTNTGNYQPSLVSTGYAGDAGGKPTPAAPTANNNNYWYNPYDSQPQLGAPSVPPVDPSFTPRDQGAVNSGMKKKSVRFEDDHEREADVESIGNSLESVLRARCVNKRLTDSYSHPSELKSAIKVGKGKGSGGADSNGKQPDHHLSNYSHQKQIFSNYHSNDDEKTKIDRFSPEKGAEMHDLKNVDNEAGVEYKSTYPIDEPVDSGSGSVLNAHQFSEDGYCENNVRRSPLSHERHLPHNHSRSETFPVDEKCCDVNEPCEEHAQDYLGGDSLDLSDENFLNGEHQRQQFATLHYSGYNDKTDNMVRHQTPGVPSTGKKSSDSKKAKNQGKDSDGNQQQGWFSGLFKTLSLKPKNQMKLPDDKNPTIVWDDKLKRWVNTAADGEDDLAPAGPPPKDSDLMGAVNNSNIAVPNGPMSLPPPNLNNDTNMQPPQPQQPVFPPNSSTTYQQHQPPTLPNQMPGPGQAPVQYQNGQHLQNQNHLQQNHQNSGMLMNVSQQQQKSDGIQNPTVPPLVNKYKLQKKGFKNNYVDVFNPNGTKSSGVNDVPVPNLAPVNAMSSPQVPNMFIPPTLPNSGSDGPVSFLTPPSEDVPPMSDQDNSLAQAQAPPMFNPAQFQQGYHQGQ